MADYNQETSATQTDDVDDGNTKTDLINMAHENPQSQDGQAQRANDVDEIPQFHDTDAHEDIAYHRSHGVDEDERPITASDITLQAQDQPLESQQTQAIKDSLDEILATQESLSLQTTDQQG